MFSTESMKFFQYFTYLLFYLHVCNYELWRFIVFEIQELPRTDELDRKNVNFTNLAKLKASQKTLLLHLDKMKQKVLLKADHFLLM